MVAPAAASTAPTSIELTLQSVHGVLWKPDKYASEDNLVSRVKACVAFLGSAPNMKVSSFTMCPRTGNLVVESNGLECETSKASNKNKPANRMSAKFDDPLEMKEARRRLSSSQSASSGASSSTYRPHLQFDMSNENEECKTSPGDDKYQQPAAAANGNGRSIELYVTLRSDDLDGSKICVEGMAKLEVPDQYETLPVTLDLPITPIAKSAVVIAEDSSSSSTTSASASAVEPSEDMILFDKGASIRVVLCLAPQQPGLSKDPSNNTAELILSENLDEIQLGGMMKKMHEKEEIEDARIRAAKLLNMRHHHHHQETADIRQRRAWFLCNGSSEFGNSFQTFLDILKGCGGHRRNLKSKGLDPDQDLFLAATMASTIDTRDSLEI
jgi:hypothetical protein